MNNSSDPMFDRYADMDFTDAKPVAQVPVLAKLQAEHGGKSRITMRVDNTTLAVFKARAEMTGGNYQTMMNEALRAYLSQVDQPVTEEVLRHVLRQEIPEYLKTLKSPPAAQAPSSATRTGRRRG